MSCMHYIAHVATIFGTVMAYAGDAFVVRKFEHVSSDHRSSQLGKLREDDTMVWSRVGGAMLI